MLYKTSEKQREKSKKWKEENKERVREQNKKWREENKEWVREYDKKWKKENRERVNGYKKKWVEENKEKVREHNKKWKEKNKEHIREYDKNYEEENKEKRREQRKNRKKERYHTDPCYKLRHLSSKMVLKSLKGGKGGESMLPYVDWNSYEELKEHLESQFEDWMTWENHGVWHPTERRWHIDHIKPQSVLLEGVTSMDDPKFRECWALENLQPLEAKENIIKGNRIL